MTDRAGWADRATERDARARVTRVGVAAASVGRRVASRVVEWLAWAVKRLLWSVRHGLGSAPGAAWAEVRHVFRGYRLMVVLWYRWVTLSERSDMLKKEMAYARSGGMLLNVKAFERRDDKTEFRQKATIVTLVLAVAGLGVAYWFYDWHALAIAGAVTTVAADLLGRLYREPNDDDPAPVSPLREGMSIRSLKKSVQEILIHHKKPVSVTFHQARVLPHGWELKCTTTDKIDDDHIDMLSRHLHAGQGMITLIRDRANVSTPWLRVFWSDPLDGAVPPPAHEPKSLSCTLPFTMTRTDNGARGELMVLGVHQLWVGQSGSGKSAGLWVLLHWLVDCADADVDGIDLTTGPLFGAYRRQMHAVAHTVEEADAILTDALDLAIARNKELNAGMDADEDGLADENWVVGPEPHRRARFVVIDEYTSLAPERGLRQKVEQLYQIGRKGRVHVVVASPTGSKDGLGSTVPITQAMVKVLFSVTPNTVLQVLGPGFADAGWRPDRFIPAAPGEPADVGKAYIQSAENPTPIVHRFDRLEPDDIREHNRNRRATQQIEAAPTLAAIEQPTAPAALPSPLHVVRRAFANVDDPETMRSADLAEAAGYRSPKSLATALKPFGVGAGPIRNGDSQVRGYKLEDVENALGSP